MPKLRLAEWASIAEVIGAVAVVVSLIYVGIQVRDNTEAVLAANRQQLIGRGHTAITSIATSPELAAAYAKLARGDKLTPAEQMQYAYIVRAMLYDVQEAFLLYREERLDEEYWKTRAALFDAYMKQELARNIYDRNKSLGILHSEFVSWADLALEEGP
jgi:hypothetical protein